MKHKRPQTQKSIVEPKPPTPQPPAPLHFRAILIVEGGQMPQLVGTEGTVDGAILARALGMLHDNLLIQIGAAQAQQAQAATDRETTEPTAPSKPVV